MHVTANGIKIHYRIDGREGAPWVTFVTGMANDLTMWDGQVAPLERDFRILRYDLRGHGGTRGHRRRLHAAAAERRSAGAVGRARRQADRISSAWGSAAR